MSLLSKTQSHSSCSTVMALLYAYQYLSLFSVLFVQSLYVPFFQRIFSCTCLHSFCTCIQQLFSYMCIYIFFADTSFTYKCTCSKYTSKEGLELLTMEFCFVKKCITGSRSAQCNMHDLSYYMRPCNSYVVALMWDYSLWLAMETSVPTYQ